MISVRSNWPVDDALIRKYVDSSSGQRTPLGTYTNDPSVNTAELSAAKKLSLYGTTVPTYCCTRSACSRMACEIGMNITPDRKSTRLNSSHRCISYAVFCLKKKKK